MKRALLVVLAAACLAAAPNATAKEGVHAHLESRLSLNAKAGTTIRVVWRLYVIEHGAKRPFGAGGLFVRLRGKADGRFARAYGDGSNGRYEATVKVPKGGLAGIRFGLEGMRMYPNGKTEPGNMYFPLDNDPFAKR